ncbi:MAG: hypothetical protein JNK15_11740 [Planctomycetes bacterium]|nr:hypothetical protein [Planctomycetota bacterium]
MSQILAFALTCGAALLAQSPQAPPVAPPAPFTGVFVSDPGADGAVWVRGERYKLGLSAGGASYQPLFGPKAPRDFPLRLQLVHAAIGDVELPSPDGVPWQRHELGFTRGRGAVTERWHVTAAGAQFTFEVAEPVANGCLLLRLAATSDMVVVDDGPGVRFVAPGLGDVRCSDATVFDAAGARLDVPVEAGDGQLVIAVPAWFTATAQWPLLVDPVLTTVAVDTTSSERQDARVACEPTTGNWLVVAEEHLSATDVDIVCTRYSSASPPVLLETVYADNTADFTHNLDVGFVAATQRFVIGWHNATSGQFQFRNRQAASTTQGATIGTSGGIGNDLENRVRIGSSFASDRFLLVLFRHQGGSAPFTTIIATFHASSGTLFQVMPLPVGTFASMQNIASPGEVSAIASASDKWVVAWPEMTATFLPNYLIRMLAIGATGSTGPLVAEPVVTLSPVSSAVVKGASIAGRGGNLLVAWERVNAATGSDIMGVPVGLVGGVFAPLGSVQNLTTQEPNALAARAQREPDVSYDGIRFLYGYLEDDGAGTTLPHAATVVTSGATLTWHEGHLPLGTAHASTFDLGFGANSTPGVHWAVFQQVGPSATGDVQAALVDARAPGATSAITQTGCGVPSEPGIAITGTPALGRTFSVALSNVPVFPILLVGPPGASPLPGCGACSLGVDTTALQLFTVSALAVNVPANPSLLQFQLAFQGMSGLQSGGCPAAFLGFAFALSDTLTITVR